MTHRAFTLMISGIAIILIALVVVAYSDVNYRSCKRNAATRNSLNQYFESAVTRGKKRENIDTGAKRFLDMQGIASAQTALRNLSNTKCSVLP